MKYCSPFCVDFFLCVLGLFVTPLSSFLPYFSAHVFCPYFWTNLAILWYHGDSLASSPNSHWFTLVYSLGAVHMWCAAFKEIDCLVHFYLIYFHRTGVLIFVMCYSFLYMPVPFAGFAHYAHTKMYMDNVACFIFVFRSPPLPWTVINTPFQFWSHRGVIIRQINLILTPQDLKI